ncbi:MAG: Tn3 family transposase [Burkholderiales bacterium]|nr:Tn3 family transposase [Burkholderiales bacterium]
MAQNNKNLLVLTQAEQAAYYEAPDFNEEQRYQFLTLSSSELDLAMGRTSWSARVHCCLQIAYFKSVNLFFKVAWDDVGSKTVTFILEQYFFNQNVKLTKITDYEYYTQCAAIVQLYGFQMWQSPFNEILLTKANELARLNINQQFIALELLTYLKHQKIIRPQYTTLQNSVISAINAERARINNLLNEQITSDESKLILALLNNENTLSELAAIKQDAKDFKPRMIQQECRKLNIMQPIYLMAKRILPSLSISKNNINNYGSFIHYYSAYDLRQHIKVEQSYLYILCYIQQRFQQIVNNLIIAFSYHQRYAQEKVNEINKLAVSTNAIEQNSSMNHMKQLVKLYVDENLADDLNFGEIRQKAFSILDKQAIIKYLVANPLTIDEVTYWESVDQVAVYLKSNVRCLIHNLNFSSLKNELLEPIAWLKNLKIKNNIADFPSLPPRLVPHLTQQHNGQSVLILNRYEYWLYSKILDSIKSGDTYFTDSLHYRNLSDELVPQDKKNTVLQNLTAETARKPISKQLDELFAKNNLLWKKFHKEYRLGNLKHLYYDEKSKKLHLKRSLLPKQEQIKHSLYKHFPFQDIVNVIKTVHKECKFLDEFTHIQPRYIKSEPNIDHLIAVILAQAMNNGNMNMADIANIPYNVLQDTYLSRIRLATLIAANDVISNSIAQMSIFPQYSFDFGILHGAVDGQKFTMATPTIKARHGKKYFGKGKGVVAYSLLCNHVLLQTYLLGSNDHESYFAFDIWYNNSSEINPQMLTGDMHILNKANSVIMYWFDGELCPRFTNIDKQLQHLYCEKWLAKYDNYAIKPRGEINRKLIEDDAENLERIIATLGSGEVSQASLIKKLCTYKQEHKTREALYEMDKLVRSNQILQYLLDPNIISTTHHSQNRLEAYHQLRADIAQAYGKKHLIGKTDLALEISNQCGRLIANIITHYNSMILSKLYDRYKAENNQKALKILKKISPIAWQHIHFQGRLIFSESAIINLDDIVKNIELAAS